MEFPNDAVKQLVEDVKTSKIPEDEEDEEDREREQRQFREISRARGSYWIGDFRKGEVVKFETTGTTWKPGRIFSERQMHEYFVAEASALCVATQVEGPDPGSKAMLRIRLQIPHGIYDPDDTGPPEDHAWKESFELGDFADMELAHLRRLTEAGCPCTPKLIDHRVEVQGKREYVPGGFKLYLLMEKVPGRNLINFGELEMSERDQVRIAFAMAIYEFYTFGFTHDDCHRRNLIWDRKNRKVYIVDLEAASPIGVTEPSLPKEFYRWGLAGVSEDPCGEEVDPMVPRRNPFDDRPFPSEQELIEMAAAAAGKPSHLEI